jgi:RND family efflux transporter MFP subunit
MKYRAVLKFFCTMVVLASAILLGRSLWNRYLNSPWTRDGRVRADVIKVASDVSGLVVGVSVRDNQQVRKGELLFTIDRERYRLALEKAEAALAARKAELAMRQQEAERRRQLENIAVSAELFQNALSQVESSSAACDEARAAVETAKLNLQRTEVRSPVNGYVTNLNVHGGDFASAGEAKLALIDKNSFAVYGYFEESKLQQLHLGDPVEIMLLGGDHPLRGKIESLAHGIADRDNPTSRELLSDVNPVMNWVRLAQRVPVRIRLDQVPKGMQLSSGMTCTVIVRPESSGGRVPALALF